MFNRLGVFAIKLTASPVRVRLLIVALLLTLMVMAVLAPGAPLFADGLPGGPHPTP